MFSLPIPRAGDPATYEDLCHSSAARSTIEIGVVVSELTNGRIQATHGAHLDPDINFHAKDRPEGWRGLFGQSRSAQGHLHNQRVGTGDVFLFFGLYRNVEQTRTGWRFVRGSMERHVLWGWLQIGRVCRIDNETAKHATIDEFSWAASHPHLSAAYKHTNNTLYIAPDHLAIGGRAVKLMDGTDAPGAGVFRRADDDLILTEPQKSATHWCLPGWFYPAEGKQALTYFGKRSWRREGQHAYVQRSGPGQEFVLNAEQYPEALDWISGLIRDFGAR